MEFPTTPWTVLADATLHGDVAAAAALEKLYVLYHQPVQAAVTARGIRGEEARDIAQSFFLHMMQRGTLHRAQREKGRFRSFLYGALRHFMADHYDRATTAKRGGGTVQVSLNDREEDALSSHTDTHVFDREWALSMLQRALAEVQAALAPGVFAVVKPFLPGSQSVPAGSSAAAAAGMNEAALRSQISRVRQKLRAHLRDEISRTVDAPHEVEEEMTYLFEVLSRG